MNAKQLKEYEAVEAEREKIFYGRGRLEIRDSIAEALILIGNNIGVLAEAVARLAATQEKPKSKGAVSYSVAHFEDQPDAQTAELRKIAGERGEE